MDGYALIAAVVAIAVVPAVYLHHRKRHEQLVKEKLQPFLAAQSRFGVLHAHEIDGSSRNDAALLRRYAEVLAKFENPNVAALEGWIESISWLAEGSGGAYRGEVYFGPGGNPSRGKEPEPIGPLSDAEFAELCSDLKLETVCDLVVEGAITREEGDRYFNRLAALARKMLEKAGDGRHSLPEFDSLLDARRAMAKPRQSAP